jgi:isopenicillin-N epimerase
MTLPPRSPLGRHWALDPGTVHLNHGSFGACPTVVLEEQARLRTLLESDPMGFFLEQAPPLWERAIHVLSGFVRADPAGMAFVVNATAGVNTVLRSLDLRPGDEVLLSDHAYRACHNAIESTCRRTGARSVVVPLPFRTEGTAPLLEPWLRAVTGRTRLAMIETVTSPTGLRMPFEPLVRELQARGVDALVDAAHGVGLLPLDLAALDAAYVTGNCHKWLCTPKGSGFLHVRRDRRDRIEPLAISHGHSIAGSAQDRFRAGFDWQGTLDPTPWLCIPRAIEHVGGLMPGGWDAVMARNHALALEARGILAGSFGEDEVAPLSLVTAMVTARLAGPPGEEFSATLGTDPLQEKLYQQHRIRAVAFRWQPHSARYLRVSAALYNSADEFRYLAARLPSLLGR